MSGFIMEMLGVFLTTLMSYAVWLLKQQRKDRDANSRATMLLLRRSLKEIHREAIEKESITEEELEDFLENYEVYHEEFNGNGIATHWKVDIEKLPIGK